MAFGLNLQALIGLARVALAAIALVGVPLADAVACSAEASPAAIEAAADADHQANPAADPSHGTEQSPDMAHCVHGHCHQSAAFNDMPSGHQLYAVTEAASPARNTSLVLPSVVGGLERPPKA